MRHEHKIMNKDNELDEVRSVVREDETFRTSGEVRTPNSGPRTFVTGSLLGGRIGQVADDVGGNAALARACAVSESVMRKWRRGDSEPVTSAMVAIAKAGGVTVEWLATGEGHMRPWEGRGAEQGRGDGYSPGLEQWALARQKVLTDGLPPEYSSIRAVAVFAREALGDEAIRVHGGVFVDLIDAAYQLLQSGADPNLVRRLIATASGHETEST